MPILSPNSAAIDACVARLHDGLLIGLPTETVYGLAANACDDAAVAAIFATKNRPQFNPLICHVADRDMAARLGQLNRHAEALIDAFWPGAVTLVVPRQAACPVGQLASAGLATIALRCPAHDLARAVLRQFNGPLAAPSANPSGQLSPTSAAHVAAALPDIPVLDGGPCPIGLESTIIGCLDDAPVWLRAGGVARAEIEAVLGQKLRDLPDEADTEARLAPGRLARHYAPRAPLFINRRGPDADALWLGFGPEDNAADANLSATGALDEAAANLFAMLHDLDAQATAQGRAIWVSPIVANGLGEAINDRLARAAASTNAE